MIHHFRVRKQNDQIFEFDSKNEEYILDNPDLYKETDHSFWVEYKDVYEEYEEDSVKKARYNLYIDDVNFGNLESLILGAVYKKEYARLLPKIDFGTSNPNYYVFDRESNEWKAPLFDIDGIKIWNISSKKYEPLPSN
jgi:hypothetical protein